MLDSERPTWPPAHSGGPEADAPATSNTPPSWPAPWDEPPGLPWWRRLWAHGQGAWIGALSAALLVVGLLCVGSTLRLPLPTGPSIAAWPHITPIARHATTRPTARHTATPTTAKTVAAVTASSVASLSVTQPTPPTTSAHTKPGGHGKHHK